MTLLAILQGLVTGVLIAAVMLLAIRLRGLSHRVDSLREQHLPTDTTDTNKWMTEHGHEWADQVVALHNGRVVASAHCSRFFDFHENEDVHPGLRNLLRKQGISLSAVTIVVTPRSSDLQWQTILQTMRCPSDKKENK